MVPSTRANSRHAGTRSFVPRRAKAATDIVGAASRSLAQVDDDNAAAFFVFFGYGKSASRNGELNTLPSLRRLLLLFFSASDLVDDEWRKHKRVPLEGSYLPL